MSERFASARNRAAGAVVYGILTLSPVRQVTVGIDPPPAIVLAVGDPMPGLDSWRRRLASTGSLGAVQ